MDRRHLRELSLLALVLAGCSLLGDAHPSSYETVQADPRHDTELAEKEHAKALEIMNGGSLCTNCDPAKAEGHLQKALIADVTYGPAHNTLGTLYLRQRKWYLAAWEYEYAIKLMPDRFEPLYNLGLVYESTEKIDRAVEYYSMAFTIAPRNADVLDSLVRARMRNGETVADVRPLLQEILFYETRPNWVAWARDQLGLAPENKTAHAAIPPVGIPNDQLPANRLPKMNLQPSDDSLPPAPKVAPRPMAPGHELSSLSGHTEPGLFDAPSIPPGTGSHAESFRAPASPSNSLGGGILIQSAGASDAIPGPTVMDGVLTKTAAQPEAGRAHFQDEGAGPRLPPAERVDRP